MTEAEFDLMTDIRDELRALRRTQAAAAIITTSNHISDAGLNRAGAVLYAAMKADE